VAEAMEANGISCRAVYGDMDADDRRATLAAFEAGKIRVLANCQILTEGWDSPDLGAVLMARPTQSKVLYIQCVGRGLRTSPGKEDCLLLDFVDIQGRHDICSFGTLAGDSSIKPRKGQTLLQATEEKEERDRGTAFVPHHVDEAFSLFERSRFAWITSGRNFRLSIGDGSAIVCSPYGGGYTVVLSSDGVMKPLSNTALPLGYAQGVAEDFARKNAKMAYIDKGAQWRREVPTQKQLDALVRMGIPVSPDLTKGEAHRMIGEVMDQPLTDKQLYTIKRNGLHKNPAVLTKREARDLIARYYQSRHGVVA
jgi:hypothetical protein